MQKEGWNDHEIAAACYSAYFRAWIQARSSMLQKVWKQIKLFLFPRAVDFYTTPKSIDLNYELAISRPFLRETELSPRLQKIYQLYIQKLERTESNRRYPHSSRFFHRLAGRLTWITRWLQGVFLATMIATCVSRQGRALRLSGFVVFAVLGATYGIVLAIAIGHSLDVSRYRVSYAPGFLLGLAMLTNYLLILAMGNHSPDEQQSKIDEAITSSVPGSPG